MRQKYFVPKEWLERPIRVLLLGAGGTGGEVLSALADTHAALNRLDHPGGLHVTVMDADEVSTANIGRQRFYPHDVGHNKALTLVHRRNLCDHTDWKALPYHWSESDASLFDRTDLLISCVDSAAVRVEIARAGESCVGTLWLDYGNGASTGQCVLGHLGEPGRARTLRLPHVFDLFPELQSVNDQNAPSCSLAEALRQQDLFVNRMLANAGMAILWTLLRHGSIDLHGAFVDVRASTMHPLPIDPDVWAFYGYPAAAESERRCA